MSSLSVSALNSYIRNLMTEDPLLRDIEVTGEISNFIHHSSGHVYFTLKDEESQIRCAMFKSIAIRYTRKLPKNGDKIVLRGSIDVYPPQGSYQIIVREFSAAGLGDLHQRFIELKEALQKEGLFDPRHKLAIPRFPKVVGIVTSPTGAAVQDVIRTIRRRYPHVKVLLSPAQVQGDGAAASIASALRLLDQTPALDVILLVRGGGSIEDLWPFNEEIVARAIYGCRTPVICGVGHETDFTIADFVSDMRASTPTAAAEIAVPDAEEIFGSLSEAERQLHRGLSRFIELRAQMLDDYENRLTQSAQNRIRGFTHQLELLETQLRSLDIYKVLERGFTVTLRDGQRITDAGVLNSGDQIETHYFKGSSISRIEKGE